MKLLSHSFAVFIFLFCININAEMVTSTINGTIKYIPELNTVVKKNQPLVKFSESSIKIKIEM
jgi:hypothetical protein